MLNKGNKGIFLVHSRHRSATINYENYDIVAEDPLLIKAFMKSRYHNGKYHHIFVLMDKSKPGRDSIKEYDCTGESGVQTAVVMTIVWYLGYGIITECIYPIPESVMYPLTIHIEQIRNN